MKNIVTIERLVIVVLIIILLFTIRQCSSNKDNSNSLQKEKEFQHQTFQSKIDSSGKETVYQKELVVDRDKSLERELLKNSELSKLNERIKFNTETQIKAIIAKYDTIKGGGTRIVYVESSTGKIDSVTCVLEGTRFKDSTMYYSLSGTIKKQGLLFDSIRFRNMFTFNLGLKRQSGITGFLKQKDATVEMISDNPYTKTLYMENIKFKDKQKFYENPFITYGLGVATMLVLMILHK